ncbi:MAG: adenylate/guanylate cyclase domain-containing protein [Methylomonas sp.]|nr:adenylate/guanylate cyclase domain-containing protein [Methylomonas sp.]
MLTDEYVYTDIAFAEIRDKHIKRTVEIALLLIALNGIGWAYFAYTYQAWAMCTVDIVGAAAASTLLLICRIKRLPAFTMTHIAMLVAFGFIWAFLLVVEGLPAGRFPTLNHWWFVATGMASCLLFVDSKKWRLVYALFSFLSFIACDQGLLHIPAFGPLPDHVAETMFKLMEAGAHSAVFIVFMLLAGVFIASISNAEVQLRRANALQESLLSNMLPQSVADRLRKEGKTFADDYLECSVLFADLVGFTTLTTKMRPEDLVKLLDNIFSEFDELTESLHLEKIKTIGDAYMVAAGLPAPRPDHAKALVSLAFKMRETIRGYADLNVRIGIHSGAVIAGVIGRRKFMYDLWGDTVNIASRMESHGVVDEIQVSEHTAELIADEFALKPRGEIEIKGRGLMNVFLVAGKHIVRPTLDTSGCNGLPTNQQYIRGGGK